MFTWRIRPNNCVFIGQRACHLRGNYAVLYLDGKRMFAHRAAWAYMTGRWPPSNKIVDHRRPELGGHYNAWSNLRLASPSQSNINKCVQKNNILGVKGVRRRPNGRFQVRFNDEVLGTFDTVAEASAAYIAAARAIHGEFANA